MTTHGVWFILIGAGITALGIWPLRIAVRHLRIGWRSRAWPTVPGRVTTSRVDKGRYWHFVVEYRYDVAGIPYDGDMLRAGDLSPGAANRAEALQKQYAAGTEVDVHYDPNRPDKAVLVPGLGSGVFLPIFWAAVFVVSGVWIIGAEVGRQANSAPSSPQITLGVAVNVPTCVAVGRADTVYVCDREPGRSASPTGLIPGVPTAGPTPPSAPQPPTGRVLQLSPGSGPRTLLGRVLSLPTGVAVDSSGTIYVVDAGYDFPYPDVLLAFKEEPTPDHPDRTSLRGTTIETLLSPGGLAMNSADTVYVADGGAVLELPTGATTARVLFDAPDDAWLSDVAVDTAGNVYATDRLRGLVLKFSPESTAPTQLPFAGLSYPEAVAVDIAGNVYVVASGRVLKLAAGSNIQTELPFSGVKDPGDVAVDTAGNVYVTDPGNRRVLKMPAQHIH